MNHEKTLLDKYQSALQGYKIARNHFENCESDFVDSAVDDLIHAEEDLVRILKEIRNDMGTKVSDN